MLAFANVEQLLCLYVTDNLVFYFFVFDLDGRMTTTKKNGNYLKRHHDHDHSQRVVCVGPGLIYIYRALPKIKALIRQTESQSVRVYTVVAHVLNVKRQKT